MRCGVGRLPLDCLSSLRGTFALDLRQLSRVHGVNIFCQVGNHVWDILSMSQKGNCAERAEELRQPVGFHTAVTLLARVLCYGGICGERANFIYKYVNTSARK